MDLRAALNAVSDVVANRPPAIRVFDQIYMKHADLLIQAELVSKWFDSRRVVFVGDGDAVGLCMTHLHALGELKQGPKEVVIVDFDERVVNSVLFFAEKYGLQDRISARLYNVADPLPQDLWDSFEAFYTNPPYGAKNSGASIQAFVRRGMEATRPDAIGCVVLADMAQGQEKWPRRVLSNVQHFLTDKGSVILEMVPRQHTYHLDDDPSLTSSTIIFQTASGPVSTYGSTALTDEEKRNFYGSNKDLVVRYVKDTRPRSESGLPISSEYEIVRLGD